MSNQLSACSMCHETFKESELFEFDALPFCKTDYEKLLKAKLQTIKTIKTTANRPDLSVAIHDEQVALFKSGKASYLKTAYQELDGAIVSVIKLISN